MISQQIIIPSLFLLADAAEHVEQLSWYQDRRWKVINVLIFAAILVYILVKKVKIGEVFDKRGAAIRAELEKARRQKDEAEARLTEVEARLNRLDQEVAEIKAEAERESARELDRIMKAAAADAEKIGQTAQREIEGATKAAKSELRAFVAEQSVQFAESIIRKEMRPEDSSRLLRKYLDELGEVS